MGRSFRANDPVSWRGAGGLGKGEGRHMRGRRSRPFPVWVLISPSQGAAMAGPEVTTGVLVHSQTGPLHEAVCRSESGKIKVKASMVVELIPRWL